MFNLPAPIQSETHTVEWKLRAFQITDGGTLAKIKPTQSSSRYWNLFDEDFQNVQEFTEEVLKQWDFEDGEIVFLPVLIKKEREDREW